MRIARIGSPDLAGLEKFTTAVTGAETPTLGRRSSRGFGGSDTPTSAPPYPESGAVETRCLFFISSVGSSFAKSEGSQAPD